jgi:hypothetical protein
VLRFWRLGSQGLWLDEWLTTTATGGSLVDLMRHVVRAEGIPPLYFIVVWAWRGVFGDSAVAFRSLSALAGVATVPVVYAAVRAFGQRRAAARIAALFVAVSPMLLWYSQEARPYAIVALIGALTMLAFARLWRSGARRDLVWWSIFCAAGVAFHYFVVFLVAAEAIALLILRREWRRVTLACIPTVAVLAAMAPIAVKQRNTKGNSAWISGIKLSWRLREVGHSAILGPTYPDVRLYWVGLAVVAIAVVLVAIRATRETRSVVLVNTGIGVGTVLLALLMAVTAFDIFLSRYLIMALIPLIIAMAIALTVARRPWLTALCVTLVCAVSLTVDISVARDRHLQRPQWAQVAAEFRRGSPNRLLALAVGGFTASPLHYYLPGAVDVTADQVVKVDEIDILVSTPNHDPCNFAVGLACSFIYLGGTVTPSLAREFKLAQQIPIGQFRLDRYRARRLVPVHTSKVFDFPPLSLLDSLVLVPHAVKRNEP